MISRFENMINNLNSDTEMQRALLQTAQGHIAKKKCNLAQIFLFYNERYNPTDSLWIP